MSNGQKSFLPTDIANDENQSVGSSSSSFVPVEQNSENAIQVINENKQFNESILKYIDNSTSSSNIGNNYHIISVFGSQSTGKSTLLNHLFNTNFDVMDESKRQQTTKGIWMAHSPLVSSTSTNGSKSEENIFVMDVEGTDGRERGEDQDFERKAALFALSTSEILIINIWETQIGLYQGANMGLLKTVFEVNLSLFGKSKLDKNDHKVLLLFVIRDHIGVTPLENLAATLTQDLMAMWDSLNIPPELSHLQFQDFFDIAFHTLGHKVLQPEKFSDDIKLLGNKIIDTNSSEYLFKKNYHHNIPVDGWTMYAESCWNQIDNNKDLDLPTQQILVAKFKCDEILNMVYDEFVLGFNEHLLTNAPSGSSDTESNIDYSELGLSFIQMRNTTFERFELAASKYNQSVYEQKRATLSSKINDKFGEIFEIYVKDLVNKYTKTFTDTVSFGKKKLQGNTFHEGITNLQQSIFQEFSENIALISLNGALEYENHTKGLQLKLDQMVSKQQIVELNSIITKSLKKLNNGLGKVIVEELNDPKSETWDNILEKFNMYVDNTVTKYEVGPGEYDFGLGTSLQTNSGAIDKLKYKSWISFHDLIHKFISKDNVLNLLKDRFDDKFRYDENGLPRLYQNGHELENSFNESKSYALEILPVLTIAKLSDGTEILPEYDIFDKRLKNQYGGASVVTTDDQQINVDSDSEDEEEEPPCFAEILSESDKAVILAKFKKEINAKFIETKRSIIQNVTQIPYYIYLVILVLGWNEFMAIIRNPLFFTLALLLGAGAYVMYHLNLLKPASIVAQRMIDESIVLAKQKLKEFLLDEHETHGNNLNKISGNKTPEGESIELDNLDPK
ncbi:Protein SEY1 [Debaryomyces fabryi]|uniref:Protein SEY1 n=1 Tax=Debaryomyces fabryi TaxID=58627 RepID=A0A0V1Q5D9_9ASCO|nr:Protein SEY1 [Debaryomyces fabryi]KSA03704.1 Protein SEY1 [Debaryomyces fabryi]CUM53402.1 unnamed protein product [Debaryomyces fabryi]